MNILINGLGSKPVLLTIGVSEKPAQVKQILAAAYIGRDLIDGEHILRALCARHGWSYTVIPQSLTLATGDDQVFERVI